MVLGVAVLAAPRMATVEISFLLGFALVLSGIAQIVHAFRFTGSPGSGSRFTLAILSMVAGVLILGNPIAGAAGITLVLICFLLFGSVAKTIFAIEAKGIHGRRWLIVSSIVSFCLGVYLLVTMRTSSLIVPGIFLGVDLIFFGASLMSFSGSLRNGRLSIQTV